MTNGEKFKEVFGFSADGSRVIAVNTTWWDSEFQNSKEAWNRRANDDLCARLLECGLKLSKPKPPKESE